MFGRTKEATFQRSRDPLKAFLPVTRCWLFVAANHIFDLIYPFWRGHKTPHFTFYTLWMAQDLFWPSWNFFWSSLSFFWVTLSQNSCLFLIPCFLCFRSCRGHLHGTQNSLSLGRRSRQVHPPTTRRTSGQEVVPVSVARRRLLESQV